MRTDKSSLVRNYFKKHKIHLDFLHTLTLNAQNHYKSILTMKPCIEGPVSVSREATSTFTMCPCHCVTQHPTGLLPRSALRQF